MLEVIRTKTPSDFESVRLRAMADDINPPRLSVSNLRTISEAQLPKIRGVFAGMNRKSQMKKSGDECRCQEPAPIVYRLSGFRMWR